LVKSVCRDNKSCKSLIWLPAHTLNTIITTMTQPLPFRYLPKLQYPILLFVSLCLAVPCQGDLITDGDFSSGVISDFENQFVFGEHDMGWGTKNDHWSVDTNGAAVRAMNASAGAAGLAQVNTVMMETGNEYELSLDWTADASATTADDLDLNVYVVAWMEGTSPTGSGDTGNRFFTGLNFQSRQSRVIGTGGSWTDLNDGSSHGGNANADAFVINGTAGTTVSSTFTLNFGGLNIEDFDYFGIKIQTDPNSTSGGGGSIDNIVLEDVSAVPEPSSLLVLFGVFAAGTCMRKRQLRI